MHTAKTNQMPINKTVSQFLSATKSNRNAYTNLQNLFTQPIPRLKVLLLQPNTKNQDILQQTKNSYVQKLRRPNRFYHSHKLQAQHYDRRNIILCFDTWMTGQNYTMIVDDARSIRILTTNEMTKKSLARRSSRSRRS